MSDASTNERPVGTDESTEQDFGKIIFDFLRDLLNTYPEIAPLLNDDLRTIARGNDNSDVTVEHVSRVKLACEKIYPEKFFDILYQNAKLFDQETPLELLPGIDFRPLWKENISDNTRETIWKYLQLILFSVVSNLSDSSSFGDTAKLFEAINEDDFKAKLEETILQMHTCFDVSGSATFDSSGINLEDLPNPESIHEHVTGMMDGKLGKLAREIAEETAGELEVDMEDESSVGDVFQKLLQEPTKLMGLVKKVGGKLDEKIKSGEIKESELLSEAGDIMEKMKEMPGMANLQNMFGNMAGGGSGGAKMNVGAMQAHLERNMKAAKQRERMKKKATQNESSHGTSSNANQQQNEQDVLDLERATQEANDALFSLLRSEGMSEEGIEKLVFSTGETYHKSRPGDAPNAQGTQEVKKKKRKKKKGKGGK